MHDRARRPSPVFVSILFVAVSALAVGDVRADGPQRFIVPSLDGPPAIVENPVDGKAYSAWAYRSGGQFDIAVSVRDASGNWSRPSFFGRFDGADQKSPALAVDGSGHVYLAFASSDSGRVVLATLALDAASWSAPIAVSPEGVRAVSPAVQIIGDRLVVAFRIGARVGLVDLPLIGSDATMQGIQDGPDPVGGKEPSGSERSDRSVPVPFGGGK